MASYDTDDWLHVSGVLGASVWEPVSVFGAGGSIHCIDSTLPVPSPIDGSILRGDLSAGTGCRPWALASQSGLQQRRRR